ncbi:hypothetical protein [Amaricoccus sp. W119]|uniref:hypothetical protein n=1 Tax=Amaricoccus sp. W119 TaxID=3391833 RepID=UPI0039A5D75B
MAFEDFRMGVAMLLDEIAKNPDNKHELQESLREKLTEMRDLGLPLPEDLVELEDYLEDDLDADREEADGEGDDPVDPAPR